jgi:hypothetical protein
MRRPAAPAQLRAARIDVVDTSQPLRVVERLDGGAVRVLWGGLRAEVSVGGVTLADDVFRAPVVGAVHGAAGWVFVAGDGAAARSDTFTSPLSVLPPLDEPGLLDGRHLASTVDTDGVVVTSDGGGPFARTPAQPPAPAVRAVFDGPSRGVSVLASGELYATVDGGRTWSYAGVSAPAAAPHVDDDGLFVSLPFDGARALLPDGTLSPPSRRRPETPTTTSMEAELASLQQRIRRALQQRNRGFLRRSEITPLPDGSALVTDETGLALLNPDGERHARVAPVTLATLSHERHGGELAGYDTFSADLSLAASVVPTRRDAAPRLRIGSAGGRTQEVVVSRQVTELAGLDAERAWGWGDDGDRRRGVPLRVDLRTGAVTSAALCEERCACTAETCVFTPDGTLFAVVDGALWREGAAGRERLTMPEGASRIAFHDRQRGMAYGARVERVWLTRDGGDSWAMVETHAPAGYEGHGAFCHAGGCSVAGVAIEGYDASRLQARVVDNPRMATRVSSWMAPWMAPWAERPPTLSCREEGALGLLPWTQPGESERVVTSPAGQARFVERTATPQDGAVGFEGRVTSIEWRGVDEAGAFHAASPWRLERNLGGRGRVGSSVRFDVLSLTRDRAVVLSTLWGDFGGPRVPHGQVWVASASELATPRATLADHADRTRWFTPTGAAFYGRRAFRPSPIDLPYGWPDRLAEVPLLVGYDGARGVSSRALADGAAAVSLAEHDGVHGALYWVAREPGRARFVPADQRVAGETLVLPSPERFPVCEGEAPPSALRVAVQAPEAPTDAAGRQDESARALYTLEFDDERACVRAAQGIDGRDSRVWAAAGGFNGVAWLPTGPVRLRCTLEVPAAVRAPETAVNGRGSAVDWSAVDSKGNPGA